MNRQRRNSRRGIIFIFLLLAMGALLLTQVPALLRLIPSRYIARMPDVVQDIAFGEATPILPTAPVPADIGGLLDPVTTTPAPATATPLPAPEVDAAPTVTPRLVATATPTVAAVAAPASIRLTGFHHQFQDWNNCGPTTLAMALSYYDLNLTQYQTAAVLKPSPEDRNVSPHEMAAYVNNETPFMAISRANGDLDLLRQLLANGIPVIVEIGLDPPGEYAWLEWYGHYLLVVAYDDEQAQIWTYDSWFGTSEVPGANATTDGRTVSYENLETYWQQFNYNYVALYRPDQAGLIAAILGDDMDDTAMYQRALAETQAQLNQDEDNAFLWFNLGTNYTALGDYARAATAFDRAREISLPWRMLWYQFGPFEAYYQQGRYEEVILLTELTLQDRPYLEEMLYYRGLAEAALGDLDAARDDLTAAVNFNPNFSPAVMALENLDAGS